MTETGYGLGESLILTLVQSVTGFSSTNTSRGDWSILNKGKAKKYAVLKNAASMKRQFQGHSLVNEPWVTQVEVWEMYERPGATYTTLQADVEAIAAKIDQYPHLGDTSGYVYTSDATEVGGPEEMWRRGGGAQWIRQIITVEWTGQRIRTFSE